MSGRSRAAWWRAELQALEGLVDADDHRSSASDEALEGQSIRDAVEMVAGVRASHRRDTHAVEVAKTCARLRYGLEAPVAGLLVANRGGAILGSDVRNRFGLAVSSVVEEAAAIIGLRFGRQSVRDPEAVFGLLSSMASRPSSLLVALADRLQVVRSTSVEGAASQPDSAMEIARIFSPVATRAGVYPIADELDEFVFRHSAPRRYAEIQEHIGAEKAVRETRVQTVRKTLEDGLAERGVAADVVACIKSVNAVHKDLSVKRQNFNEIYDLESLEVLVDDVDSCYRAMGGVRDMWKYVFRDYDDFIALPRGDQYQALEAVVATDDGFVFKVVVRAREMLGPWRLFPRAGRADAIAGQRQGWQFDLDALKDGSDGLVASTAVGERVFVFGDDGVVQPLDSGSTALDFAYAQAGDAAHRCVAVHINDQPAAFHTILRSGDKVSIQRGLLPDPAREWQGIAQTAAARDALDQWFSGVERDVGGRVVRRSISLQLGLEGDQECDPLVRIALLACARAHGVGDVNALLSGVHTGSVGVSVADVVGDAKRRLPTGYVGPVPNRTGDSDPEPESTRAAECCQPLPGDEIGVRSTAGSQTIHLLRCPDLERTGGSELVRARWGTEHGWLATIGLDVLADHRTGSLSDIIGACGSDRLKAATFSRVSGFARVRLELDVGSAADARGIVAALLRVPVVRDVVRFAPQPIEIDRQWVSTPASRS